MIPKYSLYFAYGEPGYCLGISPNPVLDAYFWQRQGLCGLYVLTYPLPLYLAHWLKRQLLGNEQGMQLQKWERLRLSPKVKAFWYWHKARALMASAQLPAPFALQPVSDLRLPAVEELELLRRLMAGRALRLTDLRQAVASLPEFQGLSLPVEELVHILVLAHECSLKPGVGRSGWGAWRCSRCGEAQELTLSDCVWCNQATCPTCPACAGMGEVRGCTPFYLMPLRGKKPLLQVSARLQFTLSLAQAEASRELVSFVQGSPSPAALLWAVCGAGKTEVVFAAIAKVLGCGGTVLFAIPRRAVVQELAPRLQQAFPTVPLLALHGETAGSLRYREARIVVATTHQVIRFYQAFTLVILDEVDAFPYRGSRFLERAVMRARNPAGKVIYLSATPGSFLKQARRAGWPVIRIPARPHGYPLPEPELVVAAIEQEPLVLSDVVVDLLVASLQRKRCVFVFVPTVNLTKPVLQALQRALKQRGLVAAGAATWASDPQRRQKQAAFSKGELAFLVTTTVAERGITVPAAEVMVLFAHVEQVFSAEALMQIAGRVGRTLAFPTGHVWFVAPQITQAMRSAQKTIRGCNQLAAQQGLLRVA